MRAHPDPTERFRTPIDDVTTPDELVDSARADGERLRAIAREQAELSGRRQLAVRGLRDRFGWSHQQVADALGISRAQAQHLYHGDRADSDYPTTSS